MGDEPDLDPESIRSFFETQVLSLDVACLTDAGLRCFERFFRHVNAKQEYIIVKHRRRHRHRRRSALYFLNHYDLIGGEWLWRAMLEGANDVAGRAIDLFADVYCYPSDRICHLVRDLHVDIVNTCREHLKASYDTISCLGCDKDSIKRIHQGATKMVRTLAVLLTYIRQYDLNYTEERLRPPLGRGFYGRDVLVIVRFTNQGRQLDDVELNVHSNQTISSVRRAVLQKLQAAPVYRVDLFMNGDPLCCGESTLLADVLPLHCVKVSAICDSYSWFKNNCHI
jgi:ubiquitin carboxyl-terminal hydrolase 9/24